MSIRTYLFTLLTGLVLIIATALSYQSGHLFIDSMNFTVEKTMFTIGQTYPEAGKQEQAVLGYHVTTNWQKVPEQVRQRFPEIPMELNVNHSIFEDWIYIAPPARIYSLMVVERAGKQIFVSRFHEDVQHKIKQHKVHGKEHFFIDPMVVVLLVGLSAIVIFVLSLIYAFKKISQPVEALQAWARKLTMTDLDTRLPDFKFKELNALAKLMHGNLTSMAGSIKREQDFLSYASHELRTPIAILTSNSVLLDKINPNPSDKERAIRERIQRASLTMKSMTETLLWLSREGETDMPVEQICLGLLVENTQQELAYLLAGKNVFVNLKTDETNCELAVTPTIIVLNNLIRNAFQHTQSGHVDIIQTQNKVQITNIESDFDDVSEVKCELGFGLGMQLVEKLTQQFGWCYDKQDIDNGYQVVIVFAQSEQTT